MIYGGIGINSSDNDTEETDDSELNNSNQNAPANVNLNMNYENDKNNENVGSTYGEVEKMASTSKQGSAKEAANDTDTIRIITDNAGDNDENSK